jgi:hypothetical protein
MLQRNQYGLKAMNTIFRRLTTGMIAALFFLAPTAFAEPQSISWRDLVPPLDESLILEGDVDLGEQVRFEMNNKKIRIPGFIVPVDFGDTRVVTRFLLVPYFGACIHEPAPPPNQTIYAEFEPGYTLESLWDPFWIEGTLLTTRVEEELATASYTLRADKIEPFVY